MPKDNDVLKMSVVSTIQLMSEKMGIDSDFDYLWGCPLESLYIMRDDMVEDYNNSLK